MEPATEGESFVPDPSETDCVVDAEWDSGEPRSGTALFVGRRVASASRSRASVCRAGVPDGWRLVRLRIRWMYAS